MRVLLIGLVFFGVGCGTGSQLSEDNIGSPTPEGRFTKQLEAMADVFVQKTAEDYDDAVERVAKAVQRGPTRIRAFNLQALGKIYQEVEEDRLDDGELDEDDALFVEQFSDFKILEDLIGKLDQYKKSSCKGKRAWYTMLDFLAGELHVAKVRNSGAVKLFEKRCDSDVVRSENKWRDYADDLPEYPYNKKWVAWEAGDRAVEAWAKRLEDYPFAERKFDTKQVLGELVKQLERIIEREDDYEMRYLENEYEDDKEILGVHELRREVRWFMIEARVLDGLVQYRSRTAEKKDNWCPIQGDEYGVEKAEFESARKRSYYGTKYEDLVTVDSLRGSKYTTMALAPNEHVCPISMCLFLGADRYVADLGEAKDVAEEDLEAAQTEDDSNDLLSDDWEGEQKDLARQIVKKADQVRDEIFEKRKVHKIENGELVERTKRRNVLSILVDELEDCR